MVSPVDSRIFAPLVFTKPADSFINRLVKTYAADPEIRKAAEELGDEISSYIIAKIKANEKVGFDLAIPILASIMLDAFASQAFGPLMEKGIMAITEGAIVIKGPGDAKNSMDALDRVLESGADGKEIMVFLKKMFGSAPTQEQPKDPDRITVFPINSKGKPN